MNVTIIKEFLIAERVSIEKYTSVLFVVLGCRILHLSKSGRFAYRLPFLYDLNTMMYSDDNTPLSLLLQIFHWYHIVRLQCFRGCLTAFSLICYTVFMFAYIPWPINNDPEPHHGDLHRYTVKFANECIFSILLLSQIYSPFQPMSIFTVLQVFIGFILFWFSFFERLGFDSRFYFSDYPPPFAISFNILRYITAPHMLARIFQWWGFALLAGNKVSFGYAFLVTCFCVANACAGHRILIANTRFFDNHAAILPFLRNV